eukprot:COSAG06_NODE_10172_length_1735_cov_9.605746_2_plen_74_part_01
MHFILLDADQHEKSGATPCPAFLAVRACAAEVVTAVRRNFMRAVAPRFRARARPAPRVTSLAGWQTEGRHGCKH